MAPPVGATPAATMSEPFRISALASCETGLRGVRVDVLWVITGALEQDLGTLVGWPAVEPG